MKRLTAVSGALAALVTAGAAVAIAHAIYPFAKAFVGRARPCNVCPDLPALSTSLDRYSCPSGHSMTAWAFFLPIGVTMPIAGAIGIVFWLLLAWARVAAAHHYPTDLFVGAALGAMAAIAASYLLMP